MIKKSNFNRIITVIIVFIGLGTLSSCNTTEMVVGMMSDALVGEDGGSTNVFLNDDDPQLVADALPFTIKLFETLLASSPNNSKLRITTASLIIMYANAFVAGPAEQYPLELFEDQFNAYVRAKKLYIRGRDMILEDLDTKYENFSQAIMANDRDYLKAFLGTLDPVESEALYWLSSSWLGAYSLDTFDFKIGAQLPLLLDILEHLYSIDPDFNNGLLRSTLLTYYSSVPVDLGGDMEKAKQLLDESILQGDEKAMGSYLTWAISVSIPEQNKLEFQDFIGRILSVDVTLLEENRLMGVLTQEKAQWYYNNQSDFFIE